MKVAEQYFHCMGCNDAAYMLKNMQKEPEKVGGNIRKSLVDPNEKLTRATKCLACILDHGMTHIDWKETCRLVKQPGNYRLPSYYFLA